MYTILPLILWMLMGIATAYMAFQRGRDPYIWFALGIFFGVFAILFLVMLPGAKSEEELENEQKSEELIERREDQMEAQEKLENAPDLQPQSVETKEWFYLDNAHKQEGPFSFYVINELWEGGKINSHTLVWTEGMVEWKQIQDTKDLYEILEHLETQSRKTFPEDL